MTSDKPFCVVQRDDILPLCPHCGQGLPEIYARSKGVALVVGRTTVFFCPHCSKVLGFAQSRMI
jgi:predicted RNA-binding Zn-ribbon protein involved in translation (DUF1610 family)